MAIRMPQELHAKVSASAARNKRTLNGELCFLLEEALRNQSRPLSTFSDAELLSALLLRHQGEPIRIEIGGTYTK